MVRLQHRRSKTDVFDVFFDPSSATLDRHARAILVALAAELNKPENAGRTFLIGGHTDATGSEAYNQLLSERRAAAVKRFFDCLLQGRWEHACDGGIRQTTAKERG